MNKETEKTMKDLDEPTLEELIEACGKCSSFELIYHPADGCPDWTTQIWFNRETLSKFGGEGKTPKEAVVCLLLSLNKK